VKFNIDKWKEIATKYGAVFDNIDFVLENEVFVKAIAIDKTKKFYLKVPFPILVYADELIIEDDFNGIKSKIDRPKELEETIKEYLDFVLSEERIEWLRKFLIELNLLPVNVKSKLRRLGFDPLLMDYKNIPKKKIKHLLLMARYLEKNKKFVLITFADFLNHDYKHGVGFSGEDNEVVLKGNPSPDGEIFAFYKAGDSFHFLNNYFFVPKPFIAYSIPININIGGG